MKETQLSIWIVVTDQQMLAGKMYFNVYVSVAIATIIMELAQEYW